MGQNVIFKINGVDFGINRNDVFGFNDDRIIARRLLFNFDGKFSFHKAIFANNFAFNRLMQSLYQSRRAQSVTIFLAKVNCIGIWDEFILIFFLSDFAFKSFYKFIWLDFFAPLEKIC